MKKHERSLRSCEMVSLPSVPEALPIVSVEAMASERARKQWLSV
jgi:hypothetical protein